jgi:type III secretion HrpO family protein
MDDQMSDALLIDLIMKCLVLVLMLTLPVIAVAALVGLLVGIFQGVTQIQDQTLAFALKMIAVILTIIFVFKWSSGQILLFGNNLLNEIPVYFR